MREILWTSSALILALLALRRLFRRTISRRAQYTLWGLVLLRLLVPANLPAAEFSLLTAAEPVMADYEVLYAAPYRVTLTAPEETPQIYDYSDDPQIVLGPASQDNSYTFTNHDQVVHEVEYTRQIALGDLLRPFWYGGMAVMACWLVLSNLFFWRKLYKGRVPYVVDGTVRRVYLVERGLPSPCLFGLFRPAIYLTPAALASPDSVRHVLAHEETHARHLDPLWSLLRGVCLTVYWFDPLVWWAALASRTDCELACDEGALRRLGEAERAAYGRTLLSLIPVRKAPANPLLSATTMTAGKRQLRDRITRIAENRTFLGRALFAAAALAALVCAVTFTGAKEPEDPARFQDVEQAVEALADDLQAYGGPDGDIMSKLAVYTPEDPPKFFDLEEGELLRVYWGVYVSLSSNLSDPLGRLCSLYRVASDENYLPGSPESDTEVLGGDGQFLYVLVHPKWAPELKAGRTEGMSLMDQVTRRVREAVLSCESLKDAPPDWAPILTIPLEDLEPYEPQEAEPLHFPYGYRNMLGGLEDPEHILGDYILLFFEGGNSSMGGEVFAGVQHAAMSSWPQPFWSFRPGAGGKYGASLFRDLLGHDGFCITYHANDGPRTITSEYYYLNEEGWPVLLARTERYSELLDLDGDGEKELSASGELYGRRLLWCRRGGRYYRLDLPQILGNYWPDGTDFNFSYWQNGGLSFQAQRPAHSADGVLSDCDSRTLYFDGESLLVYNDRRAAVNHVLNWPDLPLSIVDAAREEVKRAFDAAGDGYDDWRIVDFDGPRTLELAGASFPVFRVRYEFHSPEPRYSPALDSPDPWTDPDWPESLYLVFRDHDPGGFLTDLTFLFSMRQVSWPSADQLPRRLEGLLPDAASALVQMELDRLMEADAVNLTLLAPQGGGRRDAAPRADLAERLLSGYDWSFAEDPGSMPAGSLLVMSPGGDLSLRLWPDSDLVLLRTYRESTWLRAVPKEAEPRVFGLMRLWYDEA